MRKSRQLLLKFFYDERFDFARVSIAYIDRGAPGDTTVVRGADIARLDSQYMEVRTDRGMNCIPYHRILRINYADEVVWDRYSPEKGNSKAVPE